MSLLVTVCGAFCAFFAVSGILLGCVLVLFGGRGRRLVGTMMVLWWASGSSVAGGLLIEDVGVAVLGVVVWAAGGVALVAGSSVGPEKPPDFTEQDSGQPMLMRRERR